MNLRGEYMAEGNWGQFDQFTSAEGGAAGTLIGFGYNTVSNNDGNNTDGDATWQIDVQMQFGGYAIYAGYSDFSDDDGADGGDFDTTLLMASYYLNSGWEAYVAYNDVSNEDGESWAVGVNNYWAGQNAKWTTQYTVDGSDANDDDTTISTQLQFYF
jgi:hypothetical protein